jgi:hypothetical protein
LGLGCLVSFIEPVIITLRAQPDGIDDGELGAYFHAAAEVTPIGEPLLLSEAEAAKWKTFAILIMSATEPG